MKLFNDVTHFLMFLVLGLFVFLGPAKACADSITFNFSGSLTNSFNGNNLVTGQFTVDTTMPDIHTGAPGSITAFNFSTPVGSVTSPGWNAFLFTYTPAYSPNQNVVQFSFLTGGTFDLLGFAFETSLSSLDLSASNFLQTFQPTISSSFGSRFEYDPAPFNGGVFTSVTVTPVPEPSSLLLLGTGLLGLMGMGLYKKRLAKRLGSQLK